MSLCFKHGINRFPIIFYGKNLHLIWSWLTSYVDGVRRFKTAATNGTILRPTGDMWAWMDMVVMIMMMPVWQTHDSFTRALWQQKHLGASRRNERNENFAYQHLRCVNGFLTRRKILRHWASGFTSHPKEGVLRIFIALKPPSHRPGFNPRPLGPVAATTQPRRLIWSYKPLAVFVYLTLPILSKERQFCRDWLLPSHSSSKQPISQLSQPLWEPYPRLIRFQSNLRLSSLPV
jgi:hypothetical protein